MCAINASYPPKLKCKKGFEENGKEWNILLSHYSFNISLYGIQFFSIAIADADLTNILYKYIYMEDGGAVTNFDME